MRARGWGYVGWGACACGLCVAGAALKVTWQLCLRVSFPTACEIEHGAPTGQRHPVGNSAEGWEIRGLLCLRKTHPGGLNSELSAGPHGTILAASPICGRPGPGRTCSSQSASESVKKSTHSSSPASGISNWPSSGRE